MLDRGRRPLPGEPDFDRVKLCHCGSSSNPSQAPSRPDSEKLGGGPTVSEWIVRGIVGDTGIYHHLAQTLDPGLAQTAVVDYGRQNDLGDREDLPNRAMQRVGQNCRIWTVAAEAV